MLSTLQPIVMREAIQRSALKAIQREYICTIYPMLDRLSWDAGVRCRQKKREKYSVFVPIKRNRNIIILLLFLFHPSWKCRQSTCPSTFLSISLPMLWVKNSNASLISKFKNKLLFLAFTPKCNQQKKNRKRQTHGTRDTHTFIFNYT